jgi:hypothetical protein
MTLDGSGNLLVGQSSTTVPGAGNTTAGTSIRGTDGVFISRTTSDTSASALQVNKNTGQGAIINIASGGTTVGSIGVAQSGDRIYLSGGGEAVGLDNSGNQFLPMTTAGADNNGTIDLGKSTSRFKDLYLSGGVYLGGTGSANFLDDYEEGTFNATATSDGSATLSVSDEFYTKIGRIVHVSFTVTFSGSGNSGSLVVDDLPFSAVGTTPIGIGREDATDGYAVYGRMTSGSDDVDIWAADSISNSTAFKVASGNIRFSITYKCE